MMDLICCDHCGAATYLLAAADADAFARVDPATLCVGCDMQPLPADTPLLVPFEWMVEAAGLSGRRA